MIEATSAYWLSTLLIFGVALLLCASGFKKFVYFMSIGYGSAVAGIGVAIIVLTLGKFGWTGITAGEVPTIILATILILYGLRLAGFLLFREIKSASYRKTLQNVAGKDEKKMPVFVKATIWLFCAIMYVMQVHPVFYRMITSTTIDQHTGWIVPMIGAAIALIGLVIETVADLEKNAAKKKNPHEFVSTGLYKFVRCPNYLGEIIFWTGIFVSGCDAFGSSWVAWLVAICGYLLIVYVMLSGAKRLENRQTKGYGEEPAYQEYVKKTPILMHFIPVKSLKNWKWVK